MGFSDTSMGGSREGFPDTVHSSDNLLRYWRPVYRFIRLAERASVEDAKDLTQEFFCYLLEGDVVRRYEREKGRFRHFLKGVLRNFLSTRRRDQTRQKRGGGAWTVPIDVANLEESDAANPEEAFDRQWAADLLAESARELRESAPPLVWKAYEAYYLAGAASYDDVARALGCSVHQVKHALDEARAKLEALVWRRVGDTEEMNDLFST